MLKGTHKEMIDSLVQVAIDNITNECKDDFDIAINALQYCLQAEKSFTDKQQYDVRSTLTDDMNQLIKINLHPCPQNRSSGNKTALAEVRHRKGVTPDEKAGIDRNEGFVYYYDAAKNVCKEQIGIFGLTTQTPTITATEVKEYVIDCIKNRINELRNLSADFKEFVSQHQAAIEKFQTVTGITVLQLSQLDKNNIQFLIELTESGTKSLNKLLYQVNIPEETFVTFDVDLRNLLLKYPDSMIGLTKTAHIGWSELIAMEKTSLEVLLKNSTSFIKMIEGGQRYQDLLTLSEEQLMEKLATFLKSQRSPTQSEFTIRNEDIRQFPGLESGPYFFPQRLTRRQQLSNDANERQLHLLNQIHQIIDTLEPTPQRAMLSYIIIELRNVIRSTRHPHVQERPNNAASESTPEGMHGSIRFHDRPRSLTERFLQWEDSIFSNGYADQMAAEVLGSNNQSQPENPATDEEAWQHRRSRYFS